MNPMNAMDLCEQAQLYGIDHVCKCVRSNDELETTLASNGRFDYIYLSAHGNPEGFASEDGHVDMSWRYLSSLLCASDCMNDECVLMLSCCRGGLMDVAYNMFLTCSHICYVLGPRQSLTSSDMHICFGIFLYNMEIRGVDVACEKIRLATDQRFSCYDREEESISLMNYSDMYYGHPYD